MVSRTRTRHTGISSYQTNGGLRYRVVAPGLVDPLTGKRGPQQTKGGFRTIGEAQAARAAMLLGRAGETAANWTVRQLYDRWIAELVEGGEVTSSTVGLYEQVMTFYWLPTLGMRKLGAVTTLDLQDAIRAMQRAGAKPSTIANRYQPVRTMFGRAVDWGLLPRNPAVGVKLPRRGESPGRALSLDEVRRLLAVGDDVAPGRLFVEMLVTTGLRVGELVVLRWVDLDLDAGVLQVRRTMSKDREQRDIIREGAKTRAGIRSVLLLPETVAALRALGGGDGFVFPSLRGKPFHVNTPASWLRQRLAAAGIAGARVHDLRHTHTTMLRALGVSQAVVEARLGHKGAGISARYTHLDVGAQKEAVEALRVALYGSDDRRATRRRVRPVVQRRRRKAAG